MKKCSKCKKTKSFDKFHSNRTKKDGYANWCKKCVLIWEHSKRGKVARRKVDLKRNYNITPKQYNEFYQQQKGYCAICGIHQSKLERRLAVDHDHKTDKIRGLLCLRCNLFLGHLDENSKLISQALTYLKNHKAS